MAVAVAVAGQVLSGLWRFEALHPEWTEDEDWDQAVAWWALASPDGVVLIDPLVPDWAALDEFLEERGGCAGVVRTCHWHERSIASVASRYGAEVWAKPAPKGTPARPYDHPVPGGRPLPGGVLGFDVERGDEIVLWLPDQAALIFGDAMLRTREGELSMCPESWLQPSGGRARLREVLGELTDLPARHVLVSHGPLVLGGGVAALETALSSFHDG